MKLGRTISMSLQNLWRRKLRTILTVWGMSVGVGAMVLLISFASGLQKQNEKQILSGINATRLTVSKEKSSGFGGRQDAGQEVKTFNNDDLAKLKSFANVRGVYPSVSVPPLKVIWQDKKYDSFFQQKPVEDITDSQKKNMAAGQWWDNNTGAAIVISESTLSQWKVAAKDIVGQTVKVVIQNFSVNGVSDGASFDAKVSGVAKKSTGVSDFGSDAISHDLAERIAAQSISFDGSSQKPGAWSSIFVYVDDKDSVTNVREQIEKAGWFASGVEDLLKSINQAFLIMKIVLGIIGGIALFVALIGITNSMLMAVLERTREIGILSALGASRRTISAMFLTEAAWLGTFGALFGLLGAYLIGKGVVFGINTYLKISQSTNEGLTIIQFYIGWPLALGTLAGAIIITLLAGWIPANRAAKQDPVRSLRHE